MHVSTVLQQDLHNPRPVVAGGQVQRRRPTTVGGVAVDVQRREERQEAVLGAGPRRLQQLLLPVLASEDGAGRGVRHLGRGLAVRVPDVRIRSVLEENDANVQLSLDGCLVQTCKEMALVNGTCLPVQNNFL